ncbi:PH domain-containing protein [Actinoplanes sp. NPDC049596]|uniref:PH domain-containing protein n=1 Tax=unclassified Actinoplanes TaxID=2626549 RepID=UPI0034309FD9
MRRWERAGGRTAREKVAALMFAAGVALGGVALVVAEDHGAVLGFSAGWAVWMTGVWRLYRTGLFVSDEAVRVRWLLKTRTYPWSGIVAVSAAPALVLGEPTSRSAIWLELAEGDSVETPVQCRAEVADGEVFVAKNVGPVHHPGEFDRVLRDLDRRVQAAATADPYGPR